MNWLLKIQQILGVFWSEFFKSHDFMEYIKRILALMLMQGENSQLRWMCSLFVSPKTAAAKYGIYPIYIDASRIYVAPPTFTDIINGSAVLTEATPALSPSQSGYTGPVVASSAYPVTPPDWLTDHVLDTTLTLLSGFDYTYDPAHNIFIFSNRSYFNRIPRISAVDAQGRLTFYYVLFGHVSVAALNNDSVDGLISPALGKFAEDTWDMHVNGASIYTMKKLLGDVSGCVVCENDGRLHILGSEQGMNWVKVGDRVYGSEKALNPEFTEGIEVQRGAVLFGDLDVYLCSDSPSSSQVPGILVQTDAGELIAPNEDVPWETAVDGEKIEKILPLYGDAAVKSAYVDRCLEIRKDPTVPPLAAEASVVNPYLYVARYMRNRRFCLVTMSTASTESLEPALDEIRKSTPAEAMVNVFVKSDDEPPVDSINDLYDDGELKVGFSADICMACVAEVMTLKIKAGNVEAIRLI